MMIIELLLGAKHLAQFLAHTMLSKTVRDDGDDDVDDDNGSSERLQN